uniref:BHLH domain-containing protein n=1 Tax=Paspalum vaginatum TaxID=158149 RepID=A0A140GYM4_9POAL|nr:hypothetical protein [Paspalum vaginatum]
MALEAVVFAQASAHFGYGCGDALPWSSCDSAAGGFGDLCAGGYWDHDDLDAWAAPAGLLGDDWEALSARDHGHSSDASTDHGHGNDSNKPAPEPPAAAGRRKRRRAKVVKNKEEIETQRMTHIAVERNRRRQMNEYLAVLRDLMPPSYAHRGDQASIVGGAINYVRELEQMLQSLEVQKSIKNRRAGGGGTTDASPFAGFFSFPQYSTSGAHGCCSSTSLGSSSSNASSDASAGSAAERETFRQAALADIEVTMGGKATRASRCSRGGGPSSCSSWSPGLHHLRIPPLHLNVTTVDALVLYTFSPQVEDDSRWALLEDIATCCA